MLPKATVLWDVNIAYLKKKNARTARMRLKEEKNLIITEVVLLLFVVLTGAGIQYCANEIDEYNSETIDRLVRMNLTEGERNGERLKSLRYTIWLLLESMPNVNVDLGVDFTTYYADSLHDSEDRDIVRKYGAGEIGKAEYYNLKSLKANRNASILLSKVQKSSDRV